MALLLSWRFHTVSGVHLALGLGYASKSNVATCVYPSLSVHGDFKTGPFRQNGNQKPRAPCSEASVWSPVVIDGFPK